jgi:hypothetical protein
MIQHAGGPGIENPHHDDTVDINNKEAASHENHTHRHGHK